MHTNGEGKFWGDFLRIRISHDVDKPLCNILESHDFAENEVLFLDVKYERVPRFCSFCVHLGHSQHNCKLPVDLQEMRSSGAMVHLLLHIITIKIAM